MLPGSSVNGSPRLASFVAAAMRFFSLSASRAARALARSSAFEFDMRVFPRGRTCPPSSSALCALARWGGRFSIPETPVLGPQRRGLLDARLRGHDTDLD